MRSDRHAGPGWLVRLVAATPVGGALVLSFNGLAALARACRIDGWLAFLWPVTLDATGVVASLIWLDGRMPDDARRAARWLALTAIVLSVGGNGLQHWLIDLGQRPHVIVQIGVGSVPPLVLFAMLHVLQLATRRPARPAASRQPVRLASPVTSPAWLERMTVTIRPVAEPLGALAVPSLPINQPPAPARLALTLADRLRVVIPASQPARRNGHRPASQATTDQPALAATRVPAGGWRDHIEAASQVLAAKPGIGRPALAEELGVPESQARKLLDHLSTEANQPALAIEPAPVEETASAE